MGAWIETLSVHFVKKIFHVAPRVGAWIETQLRNTAEICQKSHPVWVRGLKRDGKQELKDINVAPRVGAWIETSNRTEQKTR